MLGMSPIDALIKTAIELAIEDMVKNPWIIESIFSPFIQIPILEKRYGYKEIARAKEFILNNKINYYMHQRNDKMDFPCITIHLTSSQEDKNLATLGDMAPCVEEYTPEEIGKPISYVIKPLNLISYDPDTGIVEIPETENYYYISPGMVAVDPDTGNGYVIIEKAGVNGFRIQTGLEIDFERIAVVPQYQTYRARMERIISQESYSIGCHVHGDPSQLAFLYAIVKYALLRYREGLFEQFSFDLGTISSSPMSNNGAFGADEVYSKFITLNGQVEEYWVKTPFRKWEVVDFAEYDGDLKQNGIKIISNTTDGDRENDVWTSIECDEEDDQ